MIGGLLRSRSGVSAMEFAMLGPLVVIVLTGAFSALSLHAGAVALEMGVSAAARRGGLGLETGEADRMAAIREVVTRHVCPRTLGLGNMCYWDPSWVAQPADPASCAGVNSTPSLSAGASNATPCATGPGLSSGVDPANPAEGASPLRIVARAYVDPRNLGKAEPFSDLPPENGVRDAGEPFTDVNQNGKWDADIGAAGLGGSGDHVIYEVAMAQPVFHPALRALVGERVIRRARIVVRNEPY